MWGGSWQSGAQLVVLSHVGKTGHSLKGHMYLMPAPGSLGAPETQVLSTRKGMERRPANKWVGGGNPDLCWPQPEDVEDW